MAKAATPEMFALADRMADDVWKNVSLLRLDTATDPQSYIYDWAIYLGTLAADVFGSTTLLLRNDKYRSAIIQIRSLVDYAIRLRYYYVQSLAPIALMTTDPANAANHRSSVEALTVWDQAELSLGKRMAQYHKDAWPADVYQDLENYAVDTNKPDRRSTPNMLMFLMAHECADRNVLPLLCPKLLKHYQNTMAEWFVHSNIVHGAQGAISDVFELDGNHQYTGRIWRRSAEISQTLLYSAFNQIHHFLETVALIRGWSYNGQGSFMEASALWESRRSAAEVPPPEPTAIEDEAADSFP